MRTLRRLAIVAVVTIVGTVVLFRSLPNPDTASPPLLSGPPQFVILSLLAALALYLRQVNLNAVDARYRIRHGELWGTFPERAYRADKLKQLQWTSDTILTLSPFMFSLILIVCGRISYDALRRFYTGWPTDALYDLDVLIVLWMSLVFVGLAIAHFIVRHKDDRIQEKVFAHEKNSQIQLELLLIKEKTTSRSGL